MFVFLLLSICDYHKNLQLIYVTCVCNLINLLYHTGLSIDIFKRLVSFDFVSLLLMLVSPAQTLEDM